MKDFFASAIFMFLLVCFIKACNSDSTQVSRSSKKAAPLYLTSDTSNKSRSTSISTFNELINSYSGRIPSEEMFLDVLENGADPNARIFLSQVEIDALRELFVQLLPDKRDDIYKTVTVGTFTLNPIDFAVSNNYEKFLDALLAKGANPNLIKNKYGTPPLQNAIMTQKVSMVKKLLAAGADCNKISVIGNAVTAAAISWQGKDTRIFGALNEWSKSRGGYDIQKDFASYVEEENIKKEYVKNSTSYEILNLVLEHGGRVDQKNSNGLVPIISALVAKNYEGVVILLDYYDDLDEVVCMHNGREIPSSFMVAASGSSELMRLVLEKGCDANRKTKYGERLIDYASNKAVRDVINEFAKNEGKTKISKKVSLQKYEIPSGWQEIVVENCVAFAIPPELEKRGGLYKEAASKFLGKDDDEKNSVMIQQAGLNEFSQESFKYYVRISYNAEPAEESMSMSFKKMQRDSLSDFEYRILNESLKEQIKMQLNLSQHPQIRGQQKLLRIDDLEIVRLGNAKTVMKMSLLRQAEGKPPVEVSNYFYVDGGIMHTFVFSYRKSEEERWLPLWEKISKMIRFAR